MKKFLFLFVLLLITVRLFSEPVLRESFEYGNHDLQVPVGWKCPDSSWLCGHLDKDHNRMPYEGEWYVFTNADESWMFIQTDLIEGIHYDFSFWAISDGGFDLELCYGYVEPGSMPTPEMMTRTIMPSTEVDLPYYQKFSTTIESDTTFAPYIGIHCTRHEGAWYLSMDNFFIDMVQQYDFKATPMTTDTTSMYVGEDAVFKFLVDNIGYDTATLTLTANNQFFTNARFYLDGQLTDRFSIAPGEHLRFEVAATMRESLNAHEICWLDVVVHSTHNCQTSMVTFWCYSLVPETDFPYFQDFEEPGVIGYDWFVMGGNSVEWKWTDMGQNPTCQPYNNSFGMMTYEASKSLVGATSVLKSKKMALNPTNNFVRFYMYRTAEKPENADRINVYYNSRATLEDAVLLTTIHRCSALSPAENEEGWHSYEVVFDADPAVGYLLFEAIGEKGLDMYLDDVLTDNEPLILNETTHTLQLFPNPVSGKLTVDADNLLNINVYNMDGVQLLSTNQSEIDLSQLSSGLYLITCVTTNGKTVQMVIKQ